MESNTKRYRDLISSLAKNFGDGEVVFSNDGNCIQSQFAFPEWTADSIEFMANCLPSSELRIGDYTLLNCNRVVQESSEMIPGVYVSSFGFIPIVVYYSGDPYVLDVCSGRVLGIEHGKYEPSGIRAGWNSNFTKLLPNIPISRRSIADTAESSFDNLFDFFDYLEDCCKEAE